MSTKLDYYKTDEGIYVANVMVSYLNRRETNPKLIETLINGKSPTKTHHVSWVFVEGESDLIKVERLKTNQLGEYNYRLKSGVPATIRDLVPTSMTLGESCEVYCGDDYEWSIGTECKYYEYRSFYTRVADKLPDYYEELPIEVTFLGEVSKKELEYPSRSTYNVVKVNSYHTTKHPLDLIGIASFSELSEMMTVDLLLHNQPCSITSQQAYSIIRGYVNDNIAPMHAKVTSDYDFCFTVKKKVAIKPFETKKEILTSRNRSYKKPRFVTNNTSHKKVEVFEMTHTARGGNYGNYTPISGFKGDTLQELVDNVSSYLDELIEHINTPVEECPHCNGTGHVLAGKFKGNKR